MAFLESTYTYYVIDPNKLIVACKNHDKRLLFDNEIIIGSSFMDIVDAQKNSGFQAVIDAVYRAIKYKRSVCQEYVSLYGDGESVCVSLLGKWEENGNLGIYLNPMERMEEMISSDLMNITETHQNLLDRELYISRTIWKYSNANIYFYDHTGLCKEVNHKMLNYFGFTQNQLVDNLNLFQFSHISEEEKDRLRRGESISYQVSYTDIIHLIYNDCQIIDDGNDKLFSVNCSPVFGKNRELIGYLSIHNDITEITRSRTDIEKLNIQISLALDAGELIVWTYDFSANNYTVLGDDPFSAVHKDKVEFLNFVLQENKEVIADAYEAILTRKSQKETFLLRATIDNKLITFRSTIIPKESEGEILHVIGVSKNISEEEKVKSDLEVANAILDKQNNELNLSNQLFQEIIEQLPGLFFVKDIDDNYKYYITNTLFCKTIPNRPMNEVIGFSDYDFFPKEMADKFRRDDLASIESKKPLEIDEKIIINGILNSRKTIKTPITLANDKKLLMCLSWDITEIDNLNHSLNNLYNESQITLEALPVGIAVHDKHGKKEYVNNVFAQMLGISDVKIYIENAVNLFEDYTLYSDLLATFKEGENFDTIIEYDLQKANNPNFIDTIDNNKMHFEVKARCIKDNNGEIIKYIIILNDITEKHLHSIEKEYNQKRIAFAIDNAEVALLEYDVIEQKFTTYRNAISSLELEPNLSVDDFFKCLDVEEASEIEFRKVISKLNEGADKSYSIDIKIKVKSETGYEWMYCTTGGSPFEKDKEGRIIKYVGFIKNNTQWVLLNNTHIELNTQLKTALNVGHMLPFVCDIKENKFNITTPEKKDSILFDTLVNVFELDQLLALLYLKDREIAQTIFNNMFKGDLSEVQMEVRFDVEYLHDKVFELNMSVVPSDEFGVSLRFIGYLQDITERQKMILELKEAKEEAEKLGKLKSAFLANMSHEIRTPLNAIVGFSELLTEADNDDIKAECLSMISTNTNLLLKLITDILDLAKIEAGFTNINPSEFDFYSFFNEIYISMRQRATNPNVSFSIVNPYSQCIVNMDKDRLAQVCINYITNAIKYTPKGSIEMGCESIDGGIRIYVKDTGIGIADYKKDQVFQRFEKLDDFAQGVGLGLSITKAIVEAMKGKLGFESEEGIGSTFWAWIPCEKVEDFNELLL